MTLKFLVLGAAAGGGLPQWNCGCINCVMARDPLSGVPPQVQSSVALTIDGQNWAIVNASPDLRAQLEATPNLHPRALRHSPIRSVLVTNGDIDHIAGLLTLREKQAFSLWATAAIHTILSDNPVFRVLDPDIVSRMTVRPETVFVLLPGLDATLFPVPGKVPLFMEGDAPEVGLESDQTVGVEFRAGGRRALYIPGCGAITEPLRERLRGADLLLFDGTVFTDDEMITTGTGQKTGRRMGHMPISGEGGSLAALQGLGIGRIVYIHINNTNPIWRPGVERDTVVSAGFEVARDGMEIKVDADS